MLVSIRRRICSTERKGNKPSTHVVGFGWRQLARAPATQHSILIIHIFHIFTSLVRAGIVTFSASRHVAQHITKEKGLTVDSTRFQQSIFPKWDTSELNAGCPAWLRPGLDET